MSKGSCGEVRGQLYAAEDQQYLSAELAKELREEAKEISRMIAGLIFYLEKNP
jgi:four helix bundle protein